MMVSVRSGLQVAQHVQNADLVAMRAMVAKASVLYEDLKRSENSLKLTPSLPNTAGRKPHAQVCGNPDEKHVQGVSQAAGLWGL
jgi:hypothetical protein